MDVTTAWVKPPRQIGGLDHLAVQAPCINIYGRLLPGITNVTDRARYYSFYPWLIWALEQAGYTSHDDRFIDAFRKADGLFTLIAHRHADTAGGEHEHHAGATVGSANLAEHISKIKAGGTVTLADYAHRSGSPQPYFKNKLGGLGQYYLGVLAELSILDGTSSTGIRYTRQLGLPLAQAMDQGVRSDLFIQTLEEGKVSADRLDELHVFCPCQLRESAVEMELLRKLFFAQDLYQDPEASPRQRTLGMLLDLGDALSEQGLPLNSIHFRGCVYSGAMPNGEPWMMPDNLAKMGGLWGVYERNELLSISIQGLFYAVLDAYAESGLALPNGTAIARWFVQESGELTPVGDVFPLDSGFSTLVAASGEWLPKYQAWGNELHEVAQAEQVVALCKAEKSVVNRARIIEAALRVLIGLAAREETLKGYDSIVFPTNYLHAYPINLGALLAHLESNWPKMRLDELLVWLFSKWGIDAHLQVALRKLRGQSQSTFRIRPSDKGLEVVDIPAAVHTSPRFNQAVRVLKDLDLLTDNGDTTHCSSAGMHYKEVAIGN
ncbi:hypothetical protein [Halioxenophilus sp. WMMB6]|uniref:hypothetical protein n=1 Tax=Halioxenophilus sp. WMMB6 TaxID=3073815 RepID=UPI00295F01CD|nr:hypothetical protein [Halioxenophilus sp. WMMB6]